MQGKVHAISTLPLKIGFSSPYRFENKAIEEVCHPPLRSTWYRSILHFTSPKRRYLLFISPPTLSELYLKLIIYGCRLCREIAYVWLVLKSARKLCHRHVYVAQHGRRILRFGSLEMTVDGTRGRAAPHTTVIPASGLLPFLSNEYSARLR